MSFSGNRRDHRRMFRLLESWYQDSRYADTACSAFAPEAVPATVLIDKLLENAVGPEQALNVKLEKLWPQVVGVQLAKVCTFLKLENSVVWVEVSHPAWSRELSRMEKVLLEKLNAGLDGGYCCGLRVVPAGRRK